jgi:hypothetical protein
MFVFAIETNGETVALIQEDNRYMLDGVLNGKRKEGRELRSHVRKEFAWDGVSPLTARLATPAEEGGYAILLKKKQISEADSESWLLCFDAPDEDWSDEPDGDDY